MAAHCIAIAGEENNSNAHIQSRIELFTGLRHYYDSDRYIHDSNCPSVFPNAEAFRSRDDGFSKISIIRVRRAACFTAARLTFKSI